METNSKTRHAVRLFLYMYPAENWKNRPGHEGEALREAKRNRELLRRVADIAETCMTADEYRSALRENLLADDTVRRLYRELHGQYLRRIIEKFCAQKEQHDQLFNSRMEKFQCNLEWFCDNVALHVSEARRHFSDKYSQN